MQIKIVPYSSQGHVRPNTLVRLLLALGVDAMFLGLFIMEDVRLVQRLGADMDERSLCSSLQRLVTRVYQYRNGSRHHISVKPSILH